MDGEISRSAILGVTLIILAALIGIGFTVFVIAKGTANEGNTAVQESLASVSQSSFVDYDQKVVTGSQVVSAYQNFVGKPVAILISTQAFTNKSDNTTTIIGGAGINSAYGSAQRNIPIVEAYTNNTFGTMVKAVKSDGTPVTSGLKFINYNAIIADPAGTNKAADYDSGTSAVSVVTSKMYFDANSWVVTTGFLTENGKVVYNNLSANLSKSAMMEYVPSTSRFNAYLLRDVSGTVLGCTFEQLSSK